MARKHRGILAAAVLIAIGVAGAIAGLRVWATYVPDPESASRAGLMRWLVLRDLESEPRETQLAVLERVEQELEQETAVTAEGDSLSDDQRRRLSHNVKFLKRFWFQRRLEEYAQCDEPQRRQFVQRQVDKLAAWIKIDEWLAATQALNGASSSEGAASAGASGAPALIAQVEAWIRETPEPRRPLAYQAVCEGVVCWLATGDLSDYAMPSRRHLARRIAQHLDGGRRADESATGLSHQQRSKLAANGELLLEAWLYDEKDRYFSLPADERAAHIDQRIDSFLRWGVLELLAEAPTDEAHAAVVSPPGASGATGRAENVTVAADASGRERTHAELVAAGLKRFLSLVEQWLKRADSDDRHELQQLVATIQQRIVWRQLQEAIGGGAAN